MSQFDVFASTELDAFETLKAERRAEIYNKGVKFTLDNSEKTLAGIANIDEKTLLLTDEINIRPGNILRSSKTGKVFVTQVQKNHGYQRVHYAEISGKLETHYLRKDGVYCPAGSIVQLRHPNGTSCPCVPTNQVPNRATFVKFGGILHEVKSTLTVGEGITELHLEPVGIKSAAPQRRVENKPQNPVEFERPFTVMTWR